MRQVKVWVLGARPKTLFAALSPIITAIFYTVYLDKFSWYLASLALLVAISLQVGVNYANDYSDGIRGTDEDRVGPIRLVGQKLASAKQVRFAAFFSFFVAAIAGLIIAITIDELWLLLVGISAIFSAWFYTGGKKPYGYAGFGEIFVFIYFGLVATMGTVYLQTKELTLVSFVLGSIMGSFAVVILLANNLRDAEKDSLVDKRTLAVQLGDRPTRILIVLLMVKPFLNLLFLMYLLDPQVWPAFLAIVWLLQPIRIIVRGAKGKELIPVLVKTGQAQLLFSLLLLLSLLF
ncbi:MAG: 1,4-dihydroxy-2-naphthoate polyprenyltransferase [Candidatus Nanopelagicales bacterium]